MIPVFVAWKCYTTKEPQFRSFNFQFGTAEFYYCRSWRHCFQPIKLEYYFYWRTLLHSHCALAVNDAILGQHYYYYAHHPVEQKLVWADWLLTLNCCIHTTIIAWHMCTVHFAIGISFSKLWGLISAVFIVRNSNSVVK